MATFEEGQQRRTIRLHDDPSLLKFIDDAIRSSGATPSMGLQLTYVDRCIGFMDALTASYVEGIRPGSAKDYDNIRSVTDRPIMRNSGP